MSEVRLLGFGKFSAPKRRTADLLVYDLSF